MGCFDFISGNEGAMQRMASCGSADSPLEAEVEEEGGRGLPALCRAVSHGIPGVGLMVGLFCIVCTHVGCVICVKPTSNSVCIAC